MPTPSQHTRAWWPVAAALFTIAWGGNQFLPMLVHYRALGEINPVIIDFGLFTYVMGMLPALFIGGPISDRWGRRAVLLPAPMIAMVSSLCLAFGEDSGMLLLIGRCISGVAIGLAMATGGAWVKELSQAPYTRGNGAKRAAMSLTAGFALGAAASSISAQWGPWPGVTPYLIHMAIALPAAIWLFRAPETLNLAANATVPLIDNLKVKAALSRRFLLVVVPAAPWVFGSAGVAYAINPSLVQEQVGIPVALSGLLSVGTLMIGFITQQICPRFDEPGTARLAKAGLVVVFIAFVLSMMAAITLNVWLILAVMLPMGLGYGLLLYTGLAEVSRIATARDLAGLTGVFYGIAYIGFAFPAICKALSEAVSYPVMLGFGAVMAVVCLTCVTIYAKTPPPSRTAE